MLQKNEIGQVIAKIVKNLLDYSRWKYDNRIKSYIDLCWAN